MKSEQEIRETRDAVISAQNKILDTFSRTFTDQKETLRLLDRRNERLMLIAAVINWALDESSSAFLDEELDALRSQHRQ